MKVGPARNAGPDTIVFDIPGIGPHTILLSPALLSVTNAVTLDGYTQSGAQANTVPLPGSSDAVLQIVLTTDDLDSAAALTLQSGSSTIRGLVIQGFLDDGIRILSSGNIVEGNYIGTTVDGTDKLVPD